uniref:Uncharacterized protein n=1 Tax=Arundo donax TaxID=35708 RepID=A0A0A9BB59_ARUDO
MFLVREYCAVHVAPHS